MPPLRTWCFLSTVSYYLRRQVESRDTRSPHVQVRRVMLGTALVLGPQTEAILPPFLLPTSQHSLGDKLESFSPGKFLCLDTSADVPWRFKKESDSVSLQSPGFCLNITTQTFPPKCPSQGRQLTPVTRSQQHNPKHIVTGGK